MTYPKLYQKANLPKPRKQPYAWVTWLAQLLAGEKNCTYAIQQQIHHQFERNSSDYDASEHDEKVIKRAAKLQAEGFTVYVENANSFKVQGKSFNICVAGRPDIIAVKNDWVVVEDIKTGKQKLSHEMQVKLYMLLLPLAPETQETCQNKVPHGRIIYNNEIVEIPAWKIDRNFKRRLRDLIGILCTSKTFKPCPSLEECRYCRISDQHCSQRIN
ncbi:PD-(D/E)XK nuclease family protein [Limnoraphis robusta Tam1]|uniref:PD-(D/E)XK nuclease family protein n=1 Tax=Limnoraphis robusta CCNP1315 TaxID=3110306 RepID=A0ABU5U0Q3_9CYAN|nr:PD-(D/E)XK nuclease family protein [Limnoraphis robusta]MEA5497669.1 PD-(D/E)XK nuclease family protein [Limnoraphis robusta BA-68 BA1]MEA5520497.1 PD-(D/E)XK nuclease family protein [Limnoraphis robusta CCNP1315]MEA5537657.1 PD-(D/E)XK nuclease family protein [Limnoraphis robusta Tam1]MEA5547010.1 PD-(D/E)XK nuclease family protein [Limnoraphis robusta CCNP1324]